MTNTALLTEILNRCGEGYENWTERAKAYFKSSVIEMVKSRRFHETQFPGLIYRKEVTSQTSASIAYTTFIQSGYEFIRWITFGFIASGGFTTLNVQILSFPEYQAWLLNSALITDATQLYAYEVSAGMGSSATLNFKTALASGDKLYPTFVAWNDVIWTTPNTDLAGHFSDEFLETAIQLSVEKLKSEIEQ
jgi:hypothetical protein